jgi:enoyl-CoA hydratase/carnithine racemase
MLSQRAKHLILTGRIFDRKYAYEHGIIDELAEEGVRQGENAGFSRGYEAGLRHSINLAAEMGKGGEIEILRTLEVLKEQL